MTTNATPPPAPPASQGPPPLDYVPTYRIGSNVPAVVGLICGVLLFVPFLTGLAALVLGRQGVRRADELHGTGRRMAQTAIVLGMVNLVLSFTVLAASFPAMGRARQRAREVQCASNLRQLSIAMFMYTSGNKGFVPPDLDALLPFLGPTGAAAICTCPDAADHGVPPATVGKAASYSYVYVPPAVQRLSQIRGAATTVAAFEPMANHGGRSVNVVYWDGHVEMLRGAAAQAKVAQLQAIVAANAARNAATSTTVPAATRPSQGPANETSDDRGDAP
jgi:prepilin-type processing-associated H-X9-DG protein